MPMPSDSNIPTYMGFSIASIIINPVLGVFATLCSVMSGSKFTEGNIYWARMFSNLAFSLALCGFYFTIIIFVMCYAYDKFPDDWYFDRNEIIAEN